ncbi:acyltransferase family protein [Marinomonas sp. 2405UD68-3]|uniref:acyltransferase family protein n=1 Tax=Marinomonas sp. 2405UD68-3 TaxID=3391835 RepID=UPI0039C9C5B2
MEAKTTNTIKAVLVLIVVAQHLCFAIWSSLYFDPVISALMIFRGDVAVGCLFLLSGYVVAKYATIKKNVWIMDRLGRLIVPMIAAFLLMYVCYKIGAGNWGVKLSSMGYEWGYVSPIGFFDDLSIQDVLASFLLQLVGFNDQLVLVAWLLRHELILSLTIFAIIGGVSKSRKYKNEIILASLLLMLIISFYFKFGFGIHSAFYLGAVIFFINRIQSTLRKVIPIECFIALSFFVYTLVVINSMQSDEWRVELISNNLAWLVLLLTDVRYFTFSLALPFIAFVTLVITKKSSMVDGFLEWLGGRSYSVYLVSQFAIQIVAMVVYKVGAYVPSIVFAGLVLALTLIMAEIFYRIIEVPSKHIISNLKLGDLNVWNKFRFKKA